MRQPKQQFSSMEPRVCQKQPPVAVRHLENLVKAVLRVVIHEFGRLAPDLAVCFFQPILGYRVTHQLVTVLPLATSTSASIKGFSWSLSISSKIARNSGASSTGSIPARMFLKINEPTISSRFVSFAYSAKVIWASMAALPESLRTSYSSLRTSPVSVLVRLTTRRSDLILPWLLLRLTSLMILDF